jgi:DNA-binding LacI/PurR family transcriptional regulator
VKRPTISDVAQRAGVSIGAVSFALNNRPGVSEQTRQRITAIADELGWRPNAAARGVFGARAHAVGLVVARNAATLGVEPFFRKFVAGLEAELASARTDLLLQVVADHAKAIEATTTWWAQRRIDGMIMTELWSEDSRVAALEAAGIPAVLVGRPRADSSRPAVWSDDAAAVTEVVDYLVGLGHRRIARVAGPPILEHTRVRTAAFRAAVARRRLRSARVVDTDSSWEAGARATQQLLAGRTPPTAIAFDNDVMATAGLGVARELGVAVPGQLSIVAGDDSPLCAMISPALTALSRDIQAYGASAARTLLRQLAGGSPGPYQAATAQLVPRESTAPAPA